MSKIIVVMDNVRFHHCLDAIKSVEEYDGIIMFLPTYFPDINPIENIFDVVKLKLNYLRPRATTRNILVIFGGNK